MGFIQYLAISDIQTSAFIYYLEVENSRQKWGYFKEDAMCDCRLATENTAHMMQCTLLALPCSLDDLNSFNNIEKKYMKRWKIALILLVLDQ